MHVVVGAVVDDYAALEVGVTVEDFDWLAVAVDAPVEDGGFGDDADRVHGDPFPEDALFGQVVGLHFALELDVEDLEGARGFECDHFARRVHDGRVGGDWAPDRVLRVRHVDDDHLRCVVDLLAHTDELVRLHGESGETDVGDVDADVLQLQVLLEFYWQLAWICHFVLDLILGFAVRVCLCLWWFCCF